MVFSLESILLPEAMYLLGDFSSAVNSAIGAGLRARVTSRYALPKLAYKDFRAEHLGMYSQHLVSVFEVAGSVLKNYRRRLRARKAASVPCVKRAMMEAEDQAYKLDRENGIVDLPITGGARFSRGAFQHDAMMALYGPGMAARPEPNGASSMAGAPV